MSKKNTLLNLQKDKSKILKEVDARIKLNKRIEVACRDLCLHKGIDPDRFICTHMPEFLVEGSMQGFYCPNPQYTMPAWCMFRDTVQSALNILEATANA
jgi:hypothetical protein